MTSPMLRNVAVPLAGGLTGFAVARTALRRRGVPRPSEYERFATRLRLAHEALRRNLVHILELIERGEVSDTAAFGRFVETFVGFLAVHHEGEDRGIFPALHEATALRSTDAAHLTRWTADHHAINSTGEALSKAGSQGRLDEVRRIGADLRDLLAPHLDDEEKVLTPAHLAEMIPERDLHRAQAMVRPGRQVALAMANLFAHSLLPEEQPAIFGEAPWLFRRVILPRASHGRFRSLEPFVWSRDLRL